MAIDHVGGPETWLYKTSAAWTIGLVTAAEIFVFISGFVMGIVYAPVVVRDGIAVASMRVLSRVWKLYLVVVGLAVFFLLVGTFTELFPAYRVDDPLSFLLGALALRMDASGLLVMYMLFVALAPLVFLAIGKGKTWLALFVSWLVYLGNWLHPHYFEVPFPVYFQFGAWQALFVTGLVIGYHNHRIGKWGSGPGRRLYVVYVFGVVGLAVFLFRLNAAVWDGEPAGAFPPPMSTWIQELSDREMLGELYANQRLVPGRLFATLVWIQAFFLAVTYLYRPVAATVGWLLIPLGQSALYAYTMHVILVYLLLPLFPSFYDIPEPLYGLAVLCFPLLLWVMVKKRFLFFIVPR